MERDWVPDGIDTEVANPARVYDYWLGGSHNFAADRRFADIVQQHVPNVPEVARANRAFLRRAVQVMLDQGLDQFLDLGSGIPTVGNVHELVHRVNPRARVVYVDSEPVAVAHSQAILAGNAAARMVQADVTSPDALLNRAEVTDLLDLTRPIGLLMVAVLHFVPDSADPAGIVARYRDRVAVGSYLALSHTTANAQTAAGSRTAADAYQQTSASVYLRTPEQVTAYAADWTLLDPGVVPVPLWRPDPDEPAPANVAGFPITGLVARRDER